MIFGCHFIELIFLFLQCVCYLENSLQSITFDGKSNAWFIFFQLLENERKSKKKESLDFLIFYLLSFRWADKHRLCSPKRKVFFYQQQQHGTGEISWKENECVCVCLFSTTTNNKMGLFFHSFFIFIYIIIYFLSFDFPSLLLY